MAIETLDRHHAYAPRIGIGPGGTAWGTTRPSILSVHFLHEPAHRTQERRQFAPLGDRLGGVETVLQRVGVTDRCAGRAGSKSSCKPSENGSFIGVAIIAVGLAVSGL